MNGAIKQILRFAEKRMPELLTASGIVFEYVAIIDAIRHTPQAKLMIEDKEQELGRELTKLEIVQTCWKCYLPTAIESTVGTACIIGGAVKYRKQNGALMALYSVSEGALAEYKKKLAETVGEEKAKLIESEIVESNVAKLETRDANILSEKSKIMLARPDTIPCYDTYSGRIFYSSRNIIEKAENDANHDMIASGGGDITLNDFYYLIGLDPIPIGAELGWTANKDLINIDFGSHLLGDIPYLSISFKPHPYDIGWRDY